MTRLLDRTAVVTGAGRGLGEGIALRFADEGANVVVVDRDRPSAEAVTAAVQARGRQALAITLDLTRPLAIDDVVARTTEAFGRLDILVNSAGIFEVASIEATTEAIWDRHMDVNLRALFFMSRAVVPQMRRQRRGRIINLSSIAGLGGFLDCPAYCASKGAIVNLTKAMACELARDGITVNAMAPGPVETPINAPFQFDQPEGDAHRRFLSERTPSGVSFYQVEDITGTAVFLASDDAGAITGHTIPIDGGWTAW